MIKEPSIKEPSIKKPKRESTKDEEQKQALRITHWHRLSTLLHQLISTMQNFIKDYEEPFWLLSKTDWLGGALSLITNRTCTMEFFKETLHSAFYVRLFRRFIIVGYLTFIHADRSQSFRTFLFAAFKHHSVWGCYWLSHTLFFFQRQGRQSVIILRLIMFE